MNFPFSFKFGEKDSFSQNTHPPFPKVPSILGQVKPDILIGTLGKAYGVNGGYVVSSKIITDYLRETAPMYIYSNPITAGEAAAVLKALEILDSPRGIEILEHIKKKEGDL